MKRLSLSAGALLSVLLTTGAYAQTPFSEKPFTDVPKSIPAYAAIEYLRTNNIVKGYLDGTFKPTRRITRAEFLTILTNPFILNQPRTGHCVPATATNTTTVNFSDVRAQDWFAEDVCFAAEKQIINGYPDGTFHPNDPISFVEAAKIISTVLTLHVRQDTKADERWYVIYVDTLSDLHAIPPTIGHLDQSITRAEMSQMLYRVKTHNDLENYNTSQQIK